MEQAAEAGVTHANNGTDGVAGETQQAAARNLRYLKRIGGWHGSAAVAALTLFGAAHTWAEVSGWLLAGLVALGAAFVAAMVLSSLFHEWGHYSGARLGGSVAPVLSKPARLYFMFNFDMQANSTKQALWMSWGGPIGSWSLVVLLVLLVPVDSWASALLIAAATGRAVNATVFEFPIIQRTRQSGEFEKELTTQLKTSGLVKAPGLVAGALSLAALAA